MSGICSVANSTSTTGPMTRATWPTRPASPPLVAWSSWVAVISTSLAPCDRLGQRVGAADDLADFLGDLRLAGLVGLAGELLEQIVGVVGGRLHGAPPRRDFGGGALQQRVIDPVLHIPREKSIQNGLRRRLEFVRRNRAFVPLLLHLLHLEREDAADLGTLREHGDELGVDEVDLVHPAFGGGPLEGLEHGAGDLGGVARRGAFGEAAPLAGQLAVAEPVPGDAL